MQIKCTLCTHMLFAHNESFCQFAIYVSTHTCQCDQYTRPYEWRVWASIGIYWRNYLVAKFILLPVPDVLQYTMSTVLTYPCLEHRIIIYFLQILRHIMLCHGVFMCKVGSVLTVCLSQRAAIMRLLRNVCLMNSSVCRCTNHTMSLRNFLCIPTTSQQERCSVTSARCYVRDLARATDKCILKLHEQPFQIVDWGVSTKPTTAIQPHYACLQAARSKFLTNIFHEVVSLHALSPSLRSNFNTFQVFVIFVARFRLIWSQGS